MRWKIAQQSWRKPRTVWKRWHDIGRTIRAVSAWTQTVCLTGGTGDGTGAYGFRARVSHEYTSCVWSLVASWRGDSGLRRGAGAGRKRSACQKVLPDCEKKVRH